MHLCLPMKIKSKVDDDNDVAAGTVPVNNFFTHWITEVEIKGYGDDTPILPLKTIKVYRCSDEMLKHLPEKALETFEETLLFNKKKVVLAGDRDKRLNNANTENERTDPN